MKHLLIFALAFVSIIANAQTISQSPASEYCPNQEYTFNVTDLPDVFYKLEHSDAIVITSDPVTTNNAHTSISFKATFGDVVGAQTFSVYWSATSNKSFTYTKVKTLISSYKNGSGSPSKIKVPLCETTPISVSLSGQYIDGSTNPGTPFGTITKFEYVIPAGWYLNTTLSDGNTPIQAIGPVTIIPDASSAAVGGLIQYRAIAECPNAFSNTTPYSISISRPNPVYTLSPPTLQLTCGLSRIQPFTVSTTNTVSCSVSYQWDLGPNNGWIYKGSAAPSTFTTPLNNITLTSIVGPAIPKPVYVTPIVNGISLPQLQCSTSWKQFLSTAVISGISYFCYPQVSSIFTINAEPNTTVTWSSNNTPIATVSNTSNTQATVTSVSPGLFNIKAIVTNICGQPDSKISSPITVGIPLPLINGTTCLTESAPCNINATANNSYLTLSLSAPTGTYVPPDSYWQWEKLYGNFYLLDNGQYTASSHTGQQCNIYLTGQNPIDNPLQLRCRVRNQCGWGAWRYYTWNDGTTTVVTPPPPPDKYYKIYPNPSGGYSANIALLDPAIIPTTNGPIVVRLYTIYGQLLSTTNMTNNSSGIVYIYSYPYTTMYITISFDSHTESQTIVKY